MTPVEAIALAYAVVLGGVAAYAWRLRRRLRAADAIARRGAEEAARRHRATAGDRAPTAETVLPPGVVDAGSP